MAAHDLSEISWRNTLSKHRSESKTLLENWGQLSYEDKESVMHKYAYFLLKNMHEERSKSDVNVDLQILEDLRKSLQNSIDDGERNYTEYQVALIHTLKKICAMLRELHCILEEGIVSPDEEFEGWIKEQLKNGEKEGYLNYVDECEMQVVKNAKAIGISINDGIINFKEIRNEKPDEVKARLTVYYKELEEVEDMPKDNVDCIADGPIMCEFIKEIISELRRIHLAEPVDDIKEERLDGVDSAELAVHDSQ